VSVHRPHRQADTAIEQQNWHLIASKGEVDEIQITTKANMLQRFEFERHFSVSFSVGRGMVVAKKVNAKTTTMGLGLAMAIQLDYWKLFSIF